MNFLKRIRTFLFGSNTYRQLLESINELKGIKTPWYSKVWTNFLDFGNHWFSELIVIPFEMIQRMIFWGWKMRYSYEWSCHSVYLMIHLQLKAIIDYSKEYAHCTWNSNYNGKEMRKLRFACELAKRLWENDYDTHVRVYQEKWGETKFSKKIFGIRKADRSRAFDMDNKQEKTEKELLFKMLNKYLDNWCD